MVKTDHGDKVAMELHSGGGAKVLVIEAPYYRAITDELIAGAEAVLGQAGVGFDRIVVPGALEIPQVFAQALARARGGAEGKGGDAARACLRLIRTAHDFGLARP